MNRRAIVATHHKTGTVWMGSTFKGICRTLNIPTVAFKRDNPSVAGTNAPVVFLDTHARWFGELAEDYRRPDDRVLHVIRDPRDVVISAMHYHRVSGEEWLHVKQADYGGLTYQEKTNSLSDDRSRYLFEMDNSAGFSIRGMANWSYSRPECFECRYEDMIADKDMSLFSRAAAHLGFDEAEIETCRREFWRNSLFSGKPQARAKKSGRKLEHIRSGGTRQWQAVFDRELAVAFLDRFGDVLIKLGYERDDAWADDLRAA